KIILYFSAPDNCKISWSECRARLTFPMVEHRMMTMFNLETIRDSGRPRIGQK
ncbi:hypothetical protein SK128_021911, partial [Halocaridina rubra]